jgi:hypothetical protein
MDNGGPQQLSCSLKGGWGGGGGGGGVGYTQKCIIETIGWFDILIDYCNIFTLIL